MIRQTSAAAYDSVLESGYVGKMQKLVYKTLYNYGPLTAREIYTRMNLNNTVNNGNVHARLVELKEYTVVSEVDTTVCQITNKLVTIFDVTSNIPMPKVKKPTKKMRRMVALKEIENLPNMSRLEIVCAVPELERLILDI